MLVEQRGKYFYENEDIRDTHDTLDTINCFSNIGVEYRSVFPIKIKTRPCVIILRRKANVIPATIEKPTMEAINYHQNGEEEMAKEDLDYTENYVDDNRQNEDVEDDDVEPDDTLDPLDTADLNDEEQSPIIETELKKPTIETKQKLRRLIERHYQFKADGETPTSDRAELIANTMNKPSIKYNIRHIIKKEKIKEMIEKISQIDLRKVCDLERESTKHCLLKIIDSYME